MFSAYPNFLIRDDNLCIMAFNHDVVFVSGSVAPLEAPTPLWTLSGRISDTITMCTQMLCNTSTPKRVCNYVEQMSDTDNCLHVTCRTQR